MPKLHISDILEKHIKQKMEELTQSMASHYESCADCEVEEIEHESNEGFWSWNNGGYIATIPLLLTSFWSSGKRTANADINARIAEIEESNFKDVCELFLDTNKEKLESLLNCEATLDNVYSLIYDNPACDELLEEFYNLENDYQSNSDDVVYIELLAVYKDSEQFRNELKQDCVMFSIGFNFDSYGREEYIKDCYSITLPVHDLDINAISKVFLEMGKAL